MYHNIGKEGIRVEETNVPFVPNELITYLEEQFSVDVILSMNFNKNNHTKLGYIEGVRDIINRLKFIQEENNNGG